MTVAIWSLLFWNYLHGGIPSHHLLAREDLPSFSNAWGGLVLPLLTWLLVYRVQLRDRQTNASTGISKGSILGFVGAFCYGLAIVLFFKMDTDVPGYLLQGIFVLALFFPLYRAQYLLGFVIGMTVTFGAVLPTLIGSVLVLISACLYLAIRPAFLFVWRKIYAPKA